MNNIEKQLKCKLEYEGKVFPSNSGDFVVTHYKNKRHVEVRFLTTDFETTTIKASVDNGTVMDKLKPSIFGVGIIGYINVAENKKAYSLWTGMLNRCYNSTYSKSASYKSCQVSSEFLRFDKFANWCKSQIGFGVKGWEMDKDILVKGNTIYSATTCCFVPKMINASVSKQNSSGVYQRKNGSWVSKVTIQNTKKTLSGFKTQDEAREAYVTAKITNIRELAETWKDQLHPDVYTALKTTDYFK